MLLLMLATHQQMQTFYGSQFWIINIFLFQMKMFKSRFLTYFYKEAALEQRL